MKVTIRTMGNSKWVLIPKRIVEQTGLIGAADLQVVSGVIEIRPVKRHPREGWADDSAGVAQHEGAALAWPEFANEKNASLQW